MKTVFVNWCSRNQFRQLNEEQYVFIDFCNPVAKEPVAAVDSAQYSSKLDLRLIVLILSSPKNVIERQTIRRTWLSEPHTHVRHVFVVGSGNFSLDALVNEQLQYQDLIIIDLFDSYANLTLKLLKSFVIIAQRYSSLYLLKTDDDSYVKLNEILAELNRTDPNYTSSNIQRNQFAHNDRNLLLYWGYFKGNANIKRSGKWQETNWVFSDKYLPYALGGGYILSFELVKYLAENQRFLQMYQSEDVSVGLWLAPITNLERRHDIRFDTEWTTRGCQNYHLITHKVRPNQMFKLHSIVMRTNRLCTNETLIRKPFMYNWNNSASLCC